MLDFLSLNMSYSDFRHLLSNNHLNLRREVVDKNLYMIGGYIKHQGQERFLDSLYRLDTTKKDKSWYKMALMSVPRCYVSTVTLHGKIFAIGGRTSSDPGRLSSGEMYDPVLDLWPLGSLSGPSWFPGHP